MYVQTVLKYVSQQLEEEHAGHRQHCSSGAGTCTQPVTAGSRQHWQQSQPPAARQSCSWGVWYLCAGTLEREKHLGEVEEIEEMWKESQRRHVKVDRIEDTTGSMFVEGGIPQQRRCFPRVTHTRAGTAACR